MPPYRVGLFATFRRAMFPYIVKYAPQSCRAEYCKPKKLCFIPSLRAIKLLQIRECYCVFEKLDSLIILFCYCSPFTFPPPQKFVRCIFFYNVPPMKMLASTCKIAIAQMTYHYRVIERIKKRNTILWVLRFFA
jgi:hypothetical protein